MCKLVRQDGEETPHAHTHVCMHAQAYTHRHTDTRILIYKHTHRHVHTHVHTCTHTRTHSTAQHLGERRRKADEITR